MVQGLVGYNWCNGVEERQLIHAKTCRDAGCQRVGRERAGRNDARCREVGDVVTHETDAGVRRNTVRHAPGEQFAVYGQRSTAGHSHVLGDLQQQAPEHGELCLEEAVSVGRICRLERVGADQLSQRVCPMRRSGVDRAHFEEIDIVPALRERPRRFAPGQASPDDRDTCETPRVLWSPALRRRSCHTPDRRPRPAGARWSNHSLDNACNHRTSGPVSYDAGSGHRSHTPDISRRAVSGAYACTRDTECMRETRRIDPS